MLRLTSSNHGIGIPVTLLPVALALTACGTGSATQIVGHPMDPLAQEEVSAVVGALIREDYVDATSNVVSSDGSGVTYSDLGFIARIDAGGVTPACPPGTF